jgi:hypothetical protein
MDSHRESRVTKLSFNYLTGSRWNIIFDLKPERGNRILMDGLPGVITSDDDFGAWTTNAWYGSKVKAITGDKATIVWEGPNSRRGEFR